MCLIIEKNVQFLIAEEDIVVYKVLDRTRHSPIYRFLYKKDELYTTAIQGSGCFGVPDEYCDKYLRKNYGEDFKSRKDLKSLGQGFHSCYTLDRARILSRDWYIIDRYGIYEAIIPKGSEYYKDETDLVVSNQIIVQEMIEL